MKLRPILFAFVVALCFAAQYAARRHLESRQARLFLENFDIISAARLQVAHKQTGDVIILGSSQTERLIPGEGIVVVSMPGSSFLGGLPFVPESLIHSNATMVLEGNRLLNGISGYVANTEKPWFKVGRRMPCFALTSRPSSLLVSFIQHGLSHGKLQSQATAPSFDVSCQTNFAAFASVAQFSPETTQTLADVVHAIRSLQASGVTVCIAIYPQTNDLTDENSEIFAAIAEVSRQTQCPVLDYYHLLGSAPLAFSDTHHFISMDARTFRFRNTLARDARTLRRQRWEP